jgi:hypothetical protein
MVADDKKNQVAEEGLKRSLTLQAAIGHRIS